VDVCPPFGQLDPHYFEIVHLGAEASYINAFSSAAI
jgi:hypothetical protein